MNQLGAWVWLLIGLAVGATSGLLAGNLPVGIVVRSVLGVTFAYALRPREKR